MSKTRLLLLYKSFRSAQSRLIKAQDRLNNVAANILKHTDKTQMTALQDVGEAQSALQAARMKLLKALAAEHEWNLLSLDTAALYKWNKEG